MNKRLTVLHLSLLDGVGDVTIQQLLELFPDITTIYQASQTDLMTLGIRANVATTIIQGLSRFDLLEQEVMLIERHGFDLITLVDDAYPEILRTIYCPPAVLYVQGAPLVWPQKAIALVGSRKAAHYVQSVTQLLVPPLVAHGWTIVSGGALGADAMAHHAALQAQGKTVAVIGSGLLEQQPHANRGLFNDIVAQGGSIVSSFPLRMVGLPKNFPARNRIIAGLSAATVVLQAAEKSGARITAMFALEQGRQVFAVPGSITDPLSMGCHMLIKEGATACISAQDLLIELGEVGLEQVDERKQQLPLVEQPIVQQMPLPKETGPEAVILAHCRAQPMGLDELMDLMQISLAELQAIMFNLQLEGKIEQTVVGSYQAF